MREVGRRAIRVASLATKIWKRGHFSFQRKALLNSICFVIVCKFNIKILWISMKAFTNANLKLFLSHWDPGHNVIIFFSYTIFLCVFVCNTSLIKWPEEFSLFFYCLTQLIKYKDYLFPGGFKKLAWKTKWI